MNFEIIVKEFNELPACTDAFIYIKDCMESLINEKSEFSSVYFILYSISRSHYSFYQDQEMSNNFSQNAKRQMTGYLNQLQLAFESGSKDNVLDTIDKISRDYIIAHKILEP